MVRGIVILCTHVHVCVYVSCHANEVQRKHHSMCLCACMCAYVSNRADEGQRNLAGVISLLHHVGFGDLYEEQV